MRRLEEYTVSFCEECPAVRLEGLGVRSCEELFCYGIGMEGREGYRGMALVSVSPTTNRSCRRLFFTVARGALISYTTVAWPITSTRVLYAGEHRPLPPSPRLSHTPHIAEGEPTPVQSLERRSRIWPHPATGSYERGRVRGLRELLARLRVWQQAIDGCENGSG